MADLAQSQPNTRFVYVADREADIQKLMEEVRRRDYTADYLIRTKHNRTLVGSEKLWHSGASQEPLGHIEFLLEVSAQRKARKVCQTLTAQRVPISWGNYYL